MMDMATVVATHFQSILLQKCKRQPATILTLTRGHIKGHIIDKDETLGLPCGTDSQFCQEALETVFDYECYFHLFTAILGYVLVVLGAVGQLPLLYKMLYYQTGKSYISTANIITMGTTTSFIVSYSVYKHLPISTWGEEILKLALFVIIANLMLMYHGTHRYSVLFTLLYFVLMIILLWPLVPGAFLIMLMVFTLPILAIRKINWIYRVYHPNHNPNSNQPVGKPHFTTRYSLTLMNVCSLGRLLTSLSDADDLLLVVFHLLEVLFNTVLTVQVLLFWVKRRRLRKSKCG